MGAKGFPTIDCRGRDVSLLLTLRHQLLLIWFLVQEVNKRQMKVPGFRKGAKLPAMYLYQIFGEEAVKGLCASLLAKDIQVSLCVDGHISQFVQVSMGSDQPCPY